MKKMKITLLVCFCVVGMITSFTGCTNVQENDRQSHINNQTDEMKAEADIFAMDTYMKITQGEVGEINENGEGTCSADTAYLHIYWSVP